ncbi:alpha/beta fold hydrolase [Parendozoicomonas haliclonae]|uniref:Pimeloyl-[acyl-carrier protein] methyl ester esterase n=1 Tax=Parendozoicomonas haliclonae TaxID=1960125 RepID=A0A1X7AII9_9GAMM|nr:alpha/beta fold hydrolase [Parendozoicomonas haliclonae]SMA45313.1 Pimeloyl-[acyl-carrier protein] methyl ester esterase [Parendozoicomonas haliclonae]
MSTVVDSVVLVSGWAMSAEVLAPLAQALEQSGWQVQAVSLAEAEGSTWEDLYTLLNSKVGQSLPVLVGWSLGGNLCSRFAAKYPDRVSGVVTLGSTPSFIARDGWTQGKHPDAYQQFADGVAANIQGAMKEFAPVCARGSHDLKGTIRALRASAKWALEQNTDWCDLLNRLAEDARSEWQQVQCPAVHLLAEQDPLAKASIADDLQALLPGQTVKVLDGSHAIFLDHTDAVVDVVTTVRNKNKEGGA